MVFIRIILAPASHFPVAPTATGTPCTHHTHARHCTTHLPDESPRSGIYQTGSRDVSVLLTHWVRRVFQAAHLMFSMYASAWRAGWKSPVTPVSGFHWNGNYLVQPLILADFPGRRHRLACQHWRGELSPHPPPPLLFLMCNKIGDDSPRQIQPTVEACSSHYKPVWTFEWWGVIGGLWKMTLYR